MKILFVANAPWAKTGYGNQTDLFWWRIQKLGYPVTLAANYGLAGSPLNISSHGEDTVVLPGGFNPHGNDMLAPYAKYTKADIVVTLYDTWVFDPAVTAQFRWVPWMPVDHDPLPEVVKAALRSAWQPIAYSKFGEAKLKEAGFDPLYVPHGIETSVFTPEDKLTARAALKLPGCEELDFFAIMVAANKGTPSRKSFPETFAAWAEFVKEHPRSALYVHSHPGKEMNGLDLVALAYDCGIPKGKIIFADTFWLWQGYSPQYMARLYSAADVLLSPSMGEGFGIPIVEAQACGCPVIVGDWTSMPELCFSGWKVQGQKFYTPLRSWQFTPRIGDIRDALLDAYDKRLDGKRRTVARKGAEAYDADLVARDYWQPVLAQIESELGTGQSDELLTLGGAA